MPLKYETSTLGVPGMLIRGIGSECAAVMVIVSPLMTMEASVASKLGSEL